jgi:flagellar assembly factor FliW
MTNESVLRELVVKEGYEVLDLKAEQIFTFPEGVPGFEQIKQYCLLSKEEEAPFLHLTAVGGYNIEFIVVSPWMILPSYNPEISKDDMEFIGSPDEQSLIILATAVVAEPFSESTVNLAAPIVINAKNGRAKQIVIRNLKDFSHQHRILEQGAT